MPLYAGTSGFAYPSWRGGFYPRDARQDELLRLYAARLPSVELNVTGYRLPSEEQLRRWAAETPASFRFAVRMSRQVTDAGRLDRFAPFLERVLTLGERLGPVLVVLPDERPRDDGLLRFLLGSALPPVRCAFELRHPTWLAPEVDDALAEAGAVRVGALDARTPFRYLRLREPPYDTAALAALAEGVRPLAEAGLDVHCYFKHEDDPRGARYAERLLELVRNGS